MIDHMTFRLTDIDRARTFYVPVMQTIGYHLVWDKEFENKWVLGFAKDGKQPDTFFTDEKPAGGPAHIAWLVSSRAEVDAFYHAVVKAGGKVHSTPSPRESYRRVYYNTLVYDMDNNLIEAVIHG